MSLRTTGSAPATRAKSPPAFASWRRLRLLPLLALVWLAVAGLAAAEAPSYRRTVEPGKARIGEPFVYRITLLHGAGERWDLAAPELPGELELLSLDRERPGAGSPPEGAAARETGEDTGEQAGGGARGRTRFSLTLASFELGVHTLPTLRLDGVTQEGRETLEVPGEAFETVAAGAGEALRDLRPPVQVPVFDPRPLIWAGAVLLLGLGVFLLLRLRRRQAPPLAPAPPAPLYERTRALLAALEAEGLPDQGQMREFHFRLSHLVRGYLAERYGVGALERTNDELVAELRERRPEGLPLDELETQLARGDLIKYARQPEDRRGCEEALAFARRLLEETRPAPPKPEESPSG